VENLNASVSPHRTRVFQVSGMLSITAEESIGWAGPIEISPLPEQYTDFELIITGQMLLPDGKWEGKILPAPTPPKNPRVLIISRSQKNPLAANWQTTVAAGSFPPVKILPLGPLLMTWFSKQNSSLGNSAVDRARSWNPLRFSLLTLAPKLHFNAEG